MKRANVVIGANFGDEGKGLMTDYFAARHGPDTIVARFNGGANAGHTVVTPEGRRHVFGHFGAGTLAGAATFLTKDFVINPALWKQEFEDIGVLTGRVPTGVMIDGRARLTTPLDRVLNQIIEHSRGEDRHGSTGVGLNETVVRCSHEHMATRAEHLNKPWRLRSDYHWQRDVWIPQRLAQLWIEFTSRMRDFVNDPAREEAFLRDCAVMAAATVVCDPDVLAGGKNVVFEGAQGLLLDEDNEDYFPHVTRSKTGIRNVITTAIDAGIDELDVTYVTRAYATRHGAGAFPMHDAAMTFHDDTNVPGEYQGAMRFGPLDVGVLCESIGRDLGEAHGRPVMVTPSLAITHVDQMGTVMPFLAYGTRGHMRTTTAIATIFRTLGMEEGFVSYGPTRKDVRPYLAGATVSRRTA